MNINQTIAVVLGMTLSLAIGYFWGWNSAFKKVDEVLEEFKDE
jgi:predicted MFS family arabinose efflux permease